ncbi:MAG: hypothetical protein NT018_14825 [Armatimonadetes bacterium]|nr:hypothetical protein [Armatimonadota bacterium]
MPTSDDSRQSQRPYLIILTVIVYAVLLFFLYTAMPYSVSKFSYCKYCRAKRDSTCYVGLIERSNIEENSLTWYWRTNIDANHNHDWQLRDSQRSSLAGPIACGSCARVDDSRLATLSIDTEIAILSSFKTPAERKAFADSFLYWNWDRKSSLGNEQRDKAMQKLQNAYKQNPARKDWQKILKQLGVIK